jgi:hypothetical protein
MRDSMLFGAPSKADYCRNRGKARSIRDYVDILASLVGLHCAVGARRVRRRRAAATASVA